MIPTYNMDPIFQQQSWQPQIMPQTNMVLPNNWGNPNIAGMGGGYPM